MTQQLELAQPDLTAIQLVAAVSWHLIPFHICLKDHTKLLCKIDVLTQSNNLSQMDHVVAAQ